MRDAKRAEHWHYYSSACVHFLLASFGDEREIRFYAEGLSGRVAGLLVRAHRVCAVVIENSFP